MINPEKRTIIIAPSYKEAVLARKAFCIKDAVCINDDQLEKVLGVSKTDTQFLLVNGADGRAAEWVRNIWVPVIRVTL